MPHLLGRIQRGVEHTRLKYICHSTTSSYVCGPITPACQWKKNGKKVPHFNKNISVNDDYGLKLEIGKIIC